VREEGKRGEERVLKEQCGKRGEGERGEERTGYSKRREGYKSNAVREEREERREEKRG